nr:hypothetical protein [Tanacetum cinerariifolium]
EEIEDDNLREKLLNVHLLIANNEALKDNPTQSFELLTKSSSTSLNSLLEETNTFHNSLLEFENFYCDLGEISSGSTITHSDISLSKYDSFIFDFAHEEFVDELTHIISSPEYDCFYFRDLPDPGITINHFYSFKPGSPHRHGAFKKFNTHRSHLNEWPMIINGKNTPILDVLLIPGNLKTLAKGFYPLSLYFLSFNWESYNLTPSSEFLTKSSSTSPKSFLEETNTFHNSLLEFENFCFDLEKISSGHTTTHSDISLLDYKAFYFDDDHIKEISSGNTTTHFDISLSKYDSFIFDFTHKEFADELAHITYPSEYDRFYFWNLPDPVELMSVLNSGIRENLSSTTRVNLLVEDDYPPLLAYVIWIFVAYLTLLHLAGSQPMLKSSYKAEDGVIISIPPLVGGVADVVVEIKGTGWSISITFWFSVGLQTPDDLSRSRLEFIKKMGVHG